MRGKRRAFSLLELIVAAGLLVVIMLGLLAMFYQTERAFRIGIAQSDILDGGRSVMEMITDELQQVRAGHEDGFANFAVAPGYPGVLQVLSAGNNEYRTNVLQSLMFLTRENDEWRGYRYDFDLNEIQGGAGTLYRLELIPSYPPWFVTNIVTSVSDVLMKKSYSDPDVLGKGYGRVLDGVVHFAVKAYDANGVLSTNVTGVNGPYFGFGFGGGDMPAYVEVELGILEPKAIQRYRGFANLPAPGYYSLQTNYVANQARRVHVFRQRVPIRSTL